MAIVNTVNKGAAPTPTTGDYLVRFIDFDGTILKEQWVNAGQAATAPTPPTHQYLTFDEWNNTFTNVQHDLDVGATYYTTDGKTYLFMRFTNTTGLQPAILLNKATTAQMNIDWGDGTGASLSGSGNITITKAAPYAAIGDYIITIECAGNYSFLNFIFNNNVNYNRCLLKCYLSSFVKSLAATFYDCGSLSLVMIPKSVSSVATHVFAYCISLKSAIIPKGITSLGIHSFVQCYALTLIVIPNTVTSIGAYSFQYCYSLKSIIIINVTIITLQIFQRCHSLNSIILSNELTSMADSIFEQCYSLKSIILPDSLITIGSSFNACNSLNWMKIPHSITSIPANTFIFCHALIRYEIMPTTPPTLVNVNAFSGINKITKIYVPDASVSAYQAATNWVTYASYIYPISELAEYAGTIFFQSNGGNAIKQIKGTVGAVATEPTAPTKTGFTFAGWYKEAALTNAWYWASDVYPATNITLYAKWV